MNPAAAPMQAPPTAEARRAYSAPGGHGLIAVVSTATVLLAPESPEWIIIGGAATSAVYLHGFLALNPRWVALELILLTVCGYVLLPPRRPFIG